MVTVRVPAPLRAQTDGRAELTASPGTVRTVLDEVVARHPGLRERLLDADGRLQRFVNVFVEEEDVRDGRGLDTAVGDGEVVTIVPAVAGGAAAAVPSAATGARHHGVEVVAVRDAAATAGWATVRSSHVRNWPKGRVRAR